MLFPSPSLQDQNQTPAIYMVSILK